MSGPRVTIDSVSRHFAGSAHPAVDNASLTVEPGSVLALLGPSGAGKTTLLRVIAGFERADTGRVLMDDRVVSSTDYSEPPEKRGIGFVFQHGALFPHLTVRANIEFGLKQLNRKERSERVLMLE
jgi:iron(III) transport system ATP-binding protein